MTTKVLHSSSMPLVPYVSQAVMIRSSIPSSSDSDSYLNCEGLEGMRDDEVSVLDLFVDMIRKSLISGCGNGIVEDSWVMEIGNPTNVRHVTHVTFDKFDGFLGLPVELQPHVPSRPLSASVSVFGVATESMQLSFDQKGNSVPAILLMMQQRLYALGGLETEGIFRINGENDQEEYVRDRINNGEIPDGVDVHCLAGLIKAWFRELPAGILDGVSPEQVLQSQTKEQCQQLIKQLPAVEYALLDWTLELMADVAEMENLNKMNAYNIAVVFAPNMTQMIDPSTALMHAVQLTNFLKLLTETKLDERRDSLLESRSCRDGLTANDPETKMSDLTAANKTVLISTENTDFHDILSMNKAGFCHRGQFNKPNSKRGSMRTVNEKEKHVRVNTRTKKLEAWR